MIEVFKNCDKNDIGYEYHAVVTVNSNNAFSIAAGGAVSVFTYYMQA